MPNKPYFTLLGAVSVPSMNATHWEIIFGDYDRETVEDERDDIKDGSDEYVSYKIIKTLDHQSCIDDKVAELNSDYFHKLLNSAAE